ncbi:MAG: PLDc N-terminal domain-containing protein [Clostridium cadaveris]|uniref:PLDc N-terminal domain-containing protein n=1 Tax=Clostridium TaxID=1485 RepID=UPI000C07D72E|nr:PLDc N-terminal domain-containing protein [Clostridium sp.]MDY4949917.1 PLDc N-terminal domain-containing protein [Clostridium cadaveris]
MDSLQQNFALILPLLILQISLIVLGLVNLFKAKRVKCLNIPIWAIIIICISIIGPILYFVFGRSQD